MANPISHSKILACLPGDHPWRDHIHCYDTVGSTNILAKELAQQGAPAGTVLIADRQTEGRGRMGRSFDSPAGMGIYLSVILRPDCPPSELMHLTCATAVSACDAIEKTLGLRPGIKWTNDLVYEGRKLCGILTELSVDAATGLVNYAVLGIGLNCHQTQEDFPPEIRSFAGSLDMAGGKAVCREALCAAMVEALEKMDSLLLSPEVFMDDYRRGCVTLGKEISILRGGEVSHGKALDIDSQGALIVLFPNGQTACVQSGEVSIRGMYGYL